MVETSNPNRVDNTSPEWLPVTQWPFDYPSQSAWRALIFNAESRRTSRGTIKGNGLIEAGAIRRVGRRVLINPAMFFAWVKNNGGAQV